jgi:cell wall-associated NlpC family hydrolase
MADFDPRITPARPDLAAKHLEGKVAAKTFADGVVQEVVAPQAPLRRAPSHEAALETEALKGEHVTIYEMTEEGWAWGQLEADGYVGWIPSNALVAPGPAPTHKVVALRTFIFPSPLIKVPPIEAVPFGARLAVAKQEDRFAVTASGGYIPAQHVALIDTKQSDFVAAAELFLHTPYLWGGKTNLGIDCSGLVQVALNACGIACPRDSDMQEKALGKFVNLTEIKRGDLVFWKGHVAIARDSKTLLHANAHHMAVAIEPMDEAIARIREAGSEITSVRRI